MNPLRARLLLLLGAALFSTGGAAVKATAVDGFALAAWRSGVAALVVFACVPNARRGVRTSALRVLPVAAFYAATLPQLGWARQATGEYRRDAEILRLDVSPAPVGATGAGAHFVLRPAKGQ